ncbi:hypothetical protein [Aureliella helgolandensis]|uniref:Uncharacterized protein n=1 Tax=Aureliella helgolandensis TaxID=2527968 RepID=A0A518GH30_9BACT|nr:hypothetical protein [Aureliella helgolandensis]QDV27880.1 hypothetical protein Q31a_62730 [Aureliella helgolandensis]
MNQTVEHWKLRFRVPVSRGRLARSGRILWLCSLFVPLLGGASGCSSLGKGALVKQLQSENDRLLSEFRSQRDRADQLAQSNRMLEERVAQTEKQLALQYQAGGGRLSQLNSNYVPSLPGSLSSFPGNAYGNSGADGAGATTGSSGLQWQPR